MGKYSLNISSYHNVTLFIIIIFRREDKVQALWDVADICVVTPVVEGGGDISG